jgi:hypothetical protein
MNVPDMRFYVDQVLSEDGEYDICLSNPPPHAGSPVVVAGVLTDEYLPLDGSQVKAIARLFAAAPDLLESLVAMMDVQDSTDDCWCDDGAKPCEACRARSAIAKARGVKP